MKFTTLSSLSVSEHWSGVRANEVALRQGSLDGACGPYALMNALMLGGYLSRKAVEKLWDDAPDGRTVFGRWSRNHPSLISAGTEAEQLRELLRGIKSCVDVKALPDLDLYEVSLPAGLSNQQRLSEVASHIDAGNPVLLCLEWDSRSAHWAVAVGHQSYVRETGGVHAHLLVVDSDSAPVPGICAWNATVGLGGEGAKRMRYTQLESLDSITCRLTAAHVLSACGT
jgi:hypothetical protein